jgi:hypothetical protein
LQGLLPVQYVADSDVRSTEQQYLDVQQQQQHHHQDQRSKQRGSTHNTEMLYHEHPVRYLRLAHPVKHPGLVRNAGVYVFPHSRLSKFVWRVNAFLPADTTARESGLPFLMTMMNGPATS